MKILITTLFLSSLVSFSQTSVLRDVSTNVQGKIETVYTTIGSFDERTFEELTVFGSDALLSLEGTHLSRVVITKSSGLPEGFLFNQ